MSERVSNAVTYSNLIFFLCRMRICFELLEMLKAHKKGIRRAAVNTFGYIAKAIGPQDVLATLLNNLKVQERQNRVCTTVAIGTSPLLSFLSSLLPPPSSPFLLIFMCLAIVAETCSPFTVLPGLMNEYRIPELNVQNGVLKSMSFLFEYIGEMGKDCIQKNKKQKMLDYKFPKKEMTI